MVAACARPSGDNESFVVEEPDDALFLAGHTGEPSVVEVLSPVEELHTPHIQRIGELVISREGEGEIEIVDLESVDELSITGEGLTVRLPRLVSAGFVSARGADIIAPQLLRVEDGSSFTPHEGRFGSELAALESTGWLRLAGIRGASMDLTKIAFDELHLDELQDCEVDVAGAALVELDRVSDLNIRIDWVDELHIFSATDLELTVGTLGQTLWGGSLLRSTLRLVGAERLQYVELSGAHRSTLELLGTHHVDFMKLEHFFDVALNFDGVRSVKRLRYPPGGDWLPNLVTAESVTLRNPRWLPNRLFEPIEPDRWPPFQFDFDVYGLDAPTRLSALESARALGVDHNVGAVELPALRVIHRTLRVDSPREEVLSLPRLERLGGIEGLRQQRLHVPALESIGLGCWEADSYTQTRPKIWALSVRGAGDFELDAPSLRVVDGPIWLSKPGILCHQPHLPARLGCGGRLAKCGEAP